MKDPAKDSQSNLFQSFIDNLPGIAFVRDTEGRYVYLNGEWERSTGLSRADIIGRKVTDVFPDEVGRTILRQDAEVLSKRTLSWRDEAIPTKDGARHFMASKFPVLDERGVVKYIGGVSIDISDRLEIERALRTSERRFRTLFEENLAGVCKTTVGGRVLECNAAFADILGWESPAALRNANAWEAYEDPEARLELLDTLHREGRVSGLECSLTRRDGRRVWVLIHARLMNEAPDPEPVIFGTILDVTARREAECAVRRKEEKYRDLVENAEIFMTTHDLSGRILSVNAFALKCLGYSEASEIVGRDMQSFLPPTWKDLFPAYIEDIRARGRVSGLMRVLTRDGEERVLAYNNSLRQKEGQPPIVQGIARDVTMHLAAQKALRESERRYRGILESIEDGYFEVDLSGALTFMNEGLGRILGYPRRELIGASYRKIMSEDAASRVFQTFNKVYSTGMPSKVLNWKIRRKSGETRHVETSVSLIRDEEGRAAGFRGIMRDVTERKLEEVRRRRLEAGLQRARTMESIGVLAQGIAHEVRNPLFALRVNAAALEREASATGRPAEFLANIQAHVKRLDGLMRDIIELSRRPGQGDGRVGEIVTSALDAVEREDPEAGRRLVMAPFTDDVRVTGIPEQISQALFHVILNALQNSPPDSLVRVDFVLTDRTFAIEVGDAGTGIDPKVEGRLFEPFVTSHKGRRGLGLALARHFVEAHGGVLNGTNNPDGPGATFRIRLRRLP